MEMLHDRFEIIVRPHGDVTWQVTDYCETSWRCYMAGLRLL